jgi:hypothetical protein
MMRGAWGSKGARGANRKDTIEQNRRLFICLEEESSMEEEWMRDRALLADLLQETPSASPRMLAQIIGRSVSWVKKWRKRFAEGDPHDPSLLCSDSRAHHAPYFRWDPRVIQKIVEMRLSPPENLKRVPGPRALLSYLPRDPELQAAQVSLPRSSRTIWKILHATGCLVPRTQEPSHPTDLRKPLEEIQMDFQDVGTVSPEQSSASASASTWSRSAILSMPAPRWLSLPRPERIFTNKRRWKR